MAHSKLPTITARAYELWEAAGRPEGRDEEFYFQAEDELRRALDALLSPPPPEMPGDAGAPGK